MNSTTWIPRIPWLNRFDAHFQLIHVEFECLTKLGTALVLNKSPLLEPHQTRNISFSPAKSKTIFCFDLKTLGRLFNIKNWIQHSPRSGSTCSFRPLSLSCVFPLNWRFITNWNNHETIKLHPSWIHLKIWNPGFIPTMYILIRNKKNPKVSMKLDNHINIHLPML